MRRRGANFLPADQLSAAISLRSGDKFNQERLDTSIKKLNEQFGLKLDQERNVELSVNETSQRVSIVILLDQELPPKDSFGRWKIKSKWYR